MRIKKVYNYQYWEKKEKNKKRKFKFENIWYKILLKISNREKYFGIEKEILKQIIKKAIIAISYLLILILISILFSKIFIFFGSDNNLIEFNKDSLGLFNNFLISSISIVGFLIALFYANLSGVFASRYAHISSRVSRELLNEYTNKKYIDAIQNYVIVIILVLLLNIIGVSNNIFLAIIILLLTIRIIIIFIQLSKRIFMYSDISIIGITTMDRIDEILKKIQVGYYNYNSANFQKHHYNLVDENINILNDLTDSLIKDKDFEGLIKLSVINLKLIADYSKIKNRIPNNSVWFPETARHKNWLEQSEIETTSALDTGTFLQPQLIKDKYFFEDRLFDINRKIIDYFIKEKKTKYVYNYFVTYHDYFESFSSSGDMNYWYNNIKENSNFIINKIDSKLLEIDDYMFGLSDLISLYPIDFVVDFSNYISKIIKIIEEINWENFNNEQMLQLNIYFMNDEKFYDFIKRLENEQLIENKLITPDWFIEEYIGSMLTEHLNTYVEIVSKIINELINTSKKLHARKLFAESSLIHGRIIELKNKMLFQLGDLKFLNEKLLKKDIGNFKYIKIDFDYIKKRIEKDYILNMEKFADIIIDWDLEKFDKEKNQLDFLGQLFYQLTFLMLELICENDYQSFSRLYSKYLIICSIVDERINSSTTKDWNYLYSLKKRITPTINFMNVSGFAIYFSHLKNDMRWEKLVLTMADDIITEESGEYIGNFANKCKSSADLCNGKLGFSLSLTDAKIQNYIKDFIKKNVPIKYEKKDYISPKKVVDHEDELINKFGYDDFDFLPDLFEIYLSCCINKYLKDNEKYKTKFNWAEEDHK